MTSDRVGKTGRADAPNALDLALEQSHEVKAKVETCADELATANENVKEQIAGGATGDELIKSADTAMYRAKKHESGCEFFDQVEKESASP